VDQSSVKEESNPETVDLVRLIEHPEWQQTTDVIQTVNLRAEEGVLVESSQEKVTLLSGRDEAVGLNADTTGSPREVTAEVSFCCVLQLSSANWPSGNVSWNPPSWEEAGLRILTCPVVG